MIQLVGVLRDCDVKVRENFAIREAEQAKKLSRLLEFFEEAIIISTCNRTEIYFTYDELNEEALDKVFEALNWNLELKKHTFHVGGQRARKHLMELACGFHSKILGEDQILGQIKDSYEKAMKVNGYRSQLQRIFQWAITCGKEFRTLAKLYEIPVSSASISVSKAVNEGLRRFMVIGYGEVGSLATKYILGSDIDKLYIVVRNPEKVQDINDERVEVVSFLEKNDKLNDTECIISATSAPHTVVRKEDLKEGYKYMIFDLAMPRDVDEEIANFKDVNLYNIDELSLLDDENKKLRKERMDEYKWVINKYLKEFENWKCTRDLSPMIQKLKLCSEKVSGDRITSFNNKSTDDNYNQMAERMIKSTADYFINRAIEVLKEEKIGGDSAHCERIVEKIFLNSIAE